MSEPEYVLWSVYVSEIWQTRTPEGDFRDHHHRYTSLLLHWFGLPPHSHHRAGYPHPHPHLDTGAGTHRYNHGNSETIGAFPFSHLHAYLYPFDHPYLDPFPDLDGHPGSHADIHTYPYKYT